MKAAAVCLLLVALAAISVDAAFYNQSRIIGNIRAGDRILDRSTAFKPRQQSQVVVSNYQYPKWGSGGFISCIRVIDRVLNGTNGDLYMNSGGVGYRSVSMSIRSKLSYGINYSIEIWGH